MDQTESPATDLDEQRALSVVVCLLSGELLAEFALSQHSTVPQLHHCRPFLSDYAGPVWQTLVSDVSDVIGCGPVYKTMPKIARQGA